MIKLSDMLEVTRKERIMGWYHSHPFDVDEAHNHCFLSSTDLSTQLLWQNAEDGNGNPFLAIVIDPLRSFAKGTAELGAFRASPPAERNVRRARRSCALLRASRGRHQHSNAAKISRTGARTAETGSTPRRSPPAASPPANQCPDGEIVTDDAKRVEVWGSCWNRYYELEVEYFMSTQVPKPRAEIRAGSRRRRGDARTVSLSRSPADAPTSRPRCRRGGAHRDRRLLPPACGGCSPRRPRPSSRS